MCHLVNRIDNHKLLQIPERYYPSKVILFGEYTVLLGGHILAVPFREKFAKWTQTKTQDNRLLGYIEYLQQHNFPELNNEKLDALRHLVLNGLVLESNIPSGYGLGSSGSVVAAVFDAVSVESDPKRCIKIFQQMEAYFHNVSSGIDPLVSYFDCPILKTEGDIMLLEIEIDIAFSLYDSERKRETSHLVDYFKERMDSDPSFAKGMQKILTTNNQIIHHIRNQKPITEDLRVLSASQYEIMQAMIDEETASKWEKDTESIWKICGAGGGGYYIKFNIQQ